MRFCFGPLTVKMGQEINQVEILQQERAHRPRTLPSFGVLDRSTIGGRVHGLLAVPVRGSWGVVGNHGDGCTSTTVVASTIISGGIM